MELMRRHPEADPAAIADVVLGNANQAVPVNQIASIRYDGRPGTYDLATARESSGNLAEAADLFKKVATEASAKPFIAELCRAQKALAEQAGKATLEFPVFLDYSDEVYAAVDNEVSAELAGALRLVWSRKTSRGFFLRAEDFFGFTKRLSVMRGELLARMAELEAEYVDPRPGSSPETLATLITVPPPAFSIGGSAECVRCMTAVTLTSSCDCSTARSAVQNSPAVANPALLTSTRTPAASRSATLARSLASARSAGSTSTVAPASSCSSAANRSSRSTSRATNTRSYPSMA